MCACPAYAVLAVNYLNQYRLQWGKADTLSALTTALDAAAYKGLESQKGVANVVESRPTVVEGPDRTGNPSNLPASFLADTPSELISVIMNDWPYSGDPFPSSLAPHTN